MKALEIILYILGVFFMIAASNSNFQADVAYATTVNILWCVFIAAALFVGSLRKQ